MQKVLSGMRPTGKLHLGHLEGVLKSYIEMQEQYQCFFMVADWHAMTTTYENPEDIHGNTIELFKDWLSVGIDPEKATLFVQSAVKAHAELFLLFSFITPVPWLERNPTYKEQKQELKDKDLSTFGFLGYPVLQAADILIYNAEKVPIGEDQRPHLELTREIARRFNFLYKTDFFKEPKEILTKFPKLPGLDNRKMSKSYNNAIYLTDDAKTVNDKTMTMYTDPLKIKKDDSGHPEGCAVYAFHKVYSGAEEQEIMARCCKGEMGCVECKKNLIVKINARLEPIRQKRAEIDKNPAVIETLIKRGNEKALVEASKIMSEVRKIMRLD